MSLEISGRIIRMLDTHVISEKFSKREFVIETGDKYPQPVILELINEKIGDLDPFKVGDDVQVAFNVRGRAWDPPGGKPTRWFVSLQVWRMEHVGSSDGPVQQDDTEIPF